MFLPFVGIIGAIMYFLDTRPTGNRLIAWVLAIIPFLNFFGAIALILDAVGAISLDK